MGNEPTPAELARVRDDAFRRFAAAPSDPASPFRMPVLATVAQSGEPRLRTVVLRSFNASSRTLAVHTDARAAKVAELRRHPVVEVLAWDPAAQVQVRLAGTATLHSHDAVADAAWASLPVGTRTTYAVGPAPGTPLPAPDAYSRDATLEAARDHFAVVAVVPNAMDWLCLAGPKHRRARFTWHGGQERACWVVP